ncbi:MAG TPA: hypothetical protein V6C86_12550 [Oculatellaceae cyanobacterium]
MSIASRIIAWTRMHLRSFSFGKRCPALSLLVTFTCILSVRPVMAQQNIVPKALTNTTAATRDAANVNAGSPSNANITTSMPSTSMPPTSPKPSTTSQVSAPVSPVGTTDSAIPTPANSSISLPLPEPGSLNEPLLRERIDQNANTSEQGGSLESYFDMRSNSLKPHENSLSTFAARAASAQGEKKPSAGRFLWHVFDNLGVPMKTDREPFIDPSLVDASPVSVPALPKEKELMSQMRTAAGQRAQEPAQTKAITGQPFQKIPESELEGVTLPALRDEARIGP